MKLLKVVTAPVRWTEKFLHRIDLLSFFVGIGIGVLYTLILPELF